MTSSTPNSVRNIQRKWTLPNRLEAVAQAGREVFDWLADLPLSSRAKYAAGAAVESALADPPDVLLVDVELPGLSGNTAVFRLRARRHRRAPTP